MTIFLELNGMEKNFSRPANSNKGLVRMNLPRKINIPIS